MQGYKKILVPVDGSEESERAVGVAIELAKRFSAEIIVCGVEKEFTGEEAEVGIVMMKETKIEDAVKKMASSAEREGFSAKMVIKTGSVAEKIIETAEEEEVNLIVIGSRGLSKIKRFLMGSVSQQVTLYSPCSVLVVK
jgi:nucleotide-binding universal stress UspA family protein